MSVFYLGLCPMQKFFVAEVLHRNLDENKNDGPYFISTEMHLASRYCFALLAVDKSRI